MSEPWEETYGEYLRHLGVKGYSGRTLKAYGACLATFLEFLEGKGVEDLKAVGREELKEYEVWLVGRKAELTGNPWSVSTRGLHIRVVKRFFGWLEWTGRILADPSLFLREPKLENPLPRALTQEEVERLLSAPDLGTPMGVRAKALLEAFYSTGLRLSEMAGLRVSDVNLEEGLVRMNQGKGGKDRVVPLGPQAGRFLRSYLEKVRPKFMMGKQEVEDLWVSKEGRSVTDQVLRLIVKQHARKAGLPKGVTTHVLRHSFATHLVRNGAPVEAVSAMLGHTKLEVTQRYLKVAASEVKETHQASHPRERET